MLSTSAREVSVVIGLAQILKSQCPSTFTIQLTIERTFENVGQRSLANLRSN
jgi:hypothetical protein